jgi:hypothetical protein
MKKSDKIWIAGMALFAVSFFATLLVDLLGLIETSNLGFVETIWISWIMWTVLLGVALAIVTRLFVKE